MRPVYCNDVKTTGCDTASNCCPNAGVLVLMADNVVSVDAPVGKTLLVIAPDIWTLSAIIGNTIGCNAASVKLMPYSLNTKLYSPAGVGPGVDPPTDADD